MGELGTCELFELMVVQLVPKSHVEVHACSSLHLTDGWTTHTHTYIHTYIRIQRPPSFPTSLPSYLPTYPPTYLPTSKVFVPRYGARSVVSAGSKISILTGNPTRHGVSEALPRAYGVVGAVRSTERTVFSVSVTVVAYNGRIWHSHLCQAGLW